jgi:hypothetical protein
VTEQAPLVYDESVRVELPGGGELAGSDEKAVSVMTQVVEHAMRFAKVQCRSLGVTRFDRQNEGLQLLMDPLENKPPQLGFFGRCVHDPADRLIG